MITQNEPYEEELKRRTKYAYNILVHELLMIIRDMPTAVATDRETQKSLVAALAKAQGEIA